jgi:hypothetical protein
MRKAAWVEIVALILVVLSGIAPGILCTGEVVAYVRLVGVNASQGQGELQYYDGDEWADVCTGAVGIIEAQMACQDLGFSFLSNIATVNEPAEADSMRSFTKIDCVSTLQREPSLSVALTTVHADECNTDYSSNDPCVSTVYLECQNKSTEDYGLVVFSDYRVFWVIAPGIPLLTECRSEQFYCNRTMLVSRSSFFLQDFEDGQTCGTVDMKFFFGVECTPGEGDVCLLSENGVCRGTGLVTYVQDQRELGVCASSFGFLEAYVACSQHGLLKLKSVSHAPLTHTLPTDVLSVDCNGTENRMSSCFIETMNNTCSDIAYLICESGDFLGESKLLIPTLEFVLQMFSLWLAYSASYMLVYTVICGCVFPPVY